MISSPLFTRIFRLPSFLIVSLLLCSALSNLHAQVPELDPQLGGTLFYVAFPDTVTNLQDERFPPQYPEAFLLQIYSPVDQKVRISCTLGGALSLQLSPGQLYECDIRTLDPLLIIPLIIEPNQ